MRHTVIILFLLLFAVPATMAQTVEEADSLMEDVADYWEEIDNYDFLYADGATFNYDFVLVQSVLDEAFSHLGTRYRYGAKGPAAFDCSGFTSYVYRRAGGLQIGSSSREQYARATPVQRRDMQRGDLVFFTSPRSRQGVGHVGIVVDYDAATDVFTFIHASTQHGVKVSRSTDGHYARRYVGVGRVKVAQ